MADGFRQVFSGANSGRGFYSLHSQSLGSRVLRLFILKGGPGVGKSTLMRKMAGDLVERGYEVELHCCSSDNDSLDGILVPQAGAAILDGTAPHVVDPRLPGIVDCIVNLGDYWDVDLLRAFRHEIETLIREISRLFGCAYRCLAATLTLMEQWEAIHLETGGLDIAYLNQMTRNLLDEAIGEAPYRQRAPLQRHLFASGITPGGCVNHLDGIAAGVERCFVLKGLPGTGRSTIVRRVAAEAAARGYDAEIFHCSLDPLKYDHVVLPALGVAVINGSDPHEFLARPTDRIVSTTSALRPDVVEQYVGEISRVRQTYTELLEQAIWYIRMAKTHHDELENHYIPAMDFDAIEVRRRRLRDEILELAAGAALEPERVVQG
ncbi:MAG: PRK06851 family protein [bacterium]|nr:PRK06851 family protein [bacterium]